MSTRTAARVTALDKGDAVLTRAGWTRVPSGPVPWWRDPASGEEYPEWRALEIARRDQGRGDA